jgi:uncharacterized protein YyaL (SSP411 family)
MIGAMARGGAILGSTSYVGAAARAADFLLNAMVQLDGTILRRYRAGEAGIGGMLDDYVFLADGLLDLYEATFEHRYLDAAINLMRKADELFGDPEAGGYYASAQADASALMKLKDDYDGAEPSGNSVALMNLARLSRITGDANFTAAADKLIAAFATRAASTPHGLPQMLAAIEFHRTAKREIVVAGTPGVELQRELWLRFDPFRILVHASPELAVYRPETAAMTAPEGGARVYVCENFACRQPVSSADDLARLLN